MNSVKHGPSRGLEGLICQGGQRRSQSIAMHLKRKRVDKVQDAAERSLVGKDPAAPAKLEKKEDMVFN